MEGGCRQRAREVEARAAFDITMDLRRVQEQLREGEIELEFSMHALVEARKDGLTAEDLIEAAMSGEAIEDYGERVLLLAFATDHKIAFHVVLEYAPGEAMATVVTAYVPDREHWQTGWKTRTKPRKKKR